MKGFAILFAILGLCSQYANAAVAVRGLIPVPEFEALAKSSPVDRAETLNFNKNNDAHATRKETGDGLSIDSAIIPREKAVDLTLKFPWHGNMMYFVFCVYYQQPEPYGTISGKDFVLKAFLYCGSELAVSEYTNFKEAYIERYGEDKFPATLRS